MSVIYSAQDIYGLTSQGKKIKIGEFKNQDANALRVGGKIFYIDSTATGATYNFYDQYGNELTDVQVGDSPYAYTVTGTGDKDKYYAFYESAYLSKTWTYKDGSSSVYNSLGTTDAIGSGKTNTSIVMAADSGAYANYANTLWNTIQTMRTNAINGCTDWFVPSMAELESLRTATDRDGNALTTLFSNTYIWSSFEYSATYAWYWHYSYQTWSYNYSNKSDGDALVAARAF